MTTDLGKFAESFCTSSSDEDITDLVRVCLHYIGSRAACNQDDDEQDDDEQNIIEAVDRMERDLGLIRLAISRRENAPRWRCGECGGTVQGQAAPKICPECDAGDPTSVIRAQWTKEAA